jgi:hypothetical protein
MTTATRPGPYRTGGPTQRRASDQDRQRAVELLRQATAKGYLSLAEFEDRMSDALAATHLEALDPLLADIPGAPAPSAAWASAPLAARPGPTTTTWLSGATGIALPLFVALVVAAAVATLFAGLWFPPVPLIVLGLVFWHRRHPCPLRSRLATHPSSASSPV